MTRTRLNPEMRNELGAMLLSGVTPTQAAERLSIPANHAIRMRKKLVKAGTVQPLRKSRKSKATKAKKTAAVTPVRTLRTTTPTVLNFRINGVDFSVDNAKSVVVENNIVDIKY